MTEDNAPPPLCIRQLLVGDTEGVVVVKLWAPVRDAYYRWLAYWSVTSQGVPHPNNEEIPFAAGADEFQALIMAMEAIQIRLDESKLALSWFKECPGGHGFPRFDQTYRPYLLDPRDFRF